MGEHLDPYPPIGRQNSGQSGHPPKSSWEAHKRSRYYDESGRVIEDRHEAIRETYHRPQALRGGGNGPTGWTGFAATAPVAVAVGVSGILHGASYWAIALLAFVVQTWWLALALFVTLWVAFGPRWGVAHVGIVWGAGGLIIADGTPHAWGVWALLVLPIAGLFGPVRWFLDDI